MNDYLRAQIDVNCYMVERGKPAAMIPIQSRYIDEALKVVQEKHNLKACIEDLSDGWSTLWIYKYSHIGEVIKSLQQAPKTTFDHWVLGKLFGYDEESIQDYLNQL